MKWLEFSVQVPSEFVEPITYLFGRYGRGLSIEEVGENRMMLRTYLNTSARQSRARIEVGVKLVGSLAPMGALEVRSLDDIGWEDAWKTHFTLLKIGKTMVVKPPWIEYQREDSDRIIELDPGLAFGTGHHPTTQMCLEILEDLICPDMTILDLGTGSGILAIAGARLGASLVVALDIDSVAVRVARKAVKDNGVRDRIKISAGSVPHKLTPDFFFDLVVANISAKAVRDCASDVKKTLKPGGKLIVGGFLEEQEASLETDLRSIGFSMEARRKVEDWVTFVMGIGG